jgi:NADPH2:quinone reductase
MKAAWYQQIGEAKQVLICGELPTPQPNAGEVRVRLQTSGVNPSDVKSRRNRAMTDALIVPHSDGAGVIDSVGAGVDAARIGESVWVWNAQYGRPMGTAAEYLVVPQAQAVPLPKGVSMQAGACLGIPALTALRGINIVSDADGLSGKTVLVTGAASAVGHYAVQMAKLRGARVIGTASAARFAHARSAGADEVLDYRHEDIPAKVKQLTHGQGVDAIIDMDFSTTLGWVSQGVMKPHGHWACYGSNVAADVPFPFRALMWHSYRLSLYLVYDLLPHEREQTQYQLQQMLQQGLLQHSIGASFQLDQIVQAHEAVEAGQVIGNVVINL